MATLTKGKTFTNGELVTPQKLHELVDLGTVNGIVNADISVSAAIADTKLAQITTANKVANSATSAASANTANAIVVRDASGNFSAGTITAALSGNAATATTAASCSGNAATATTLQTARTINGVSFNGSANITVTADPNAHTHDDRYYTESEINTLLAGKQAAGSYAASSHTHAISDTTGLQTALDGKQAAGSYAPATGIAQSAVTNLTTDLAGKAASSHTHDDRYYTETEVNTLLAGKQASLNDSSEIRLLIDSGLGAGQEGIDLFYGYTDPRIFINSYGTTASPYLEFGVGYTIRGSITRNAAGTAVAYNTTSDYRLKTNIEPLSDAVARLLQIPVHRFNWLADPTAPKVDGFLAHEAQAIVPESVTGRKDEVDAEGNPIHQGIDQSKLVPLLVAAVQELAARVAALEAR